MFFASAKRLKDCTLRSPEQRWRNVTLFPFFDDGGVIIKHMLLVPQVGVYIIDADAGVLSLDLWLSPRLAEPLSSCRKIGMDRIAVLGRLRHFDPWWLLKRPEYNGLPWVPILKATNCVHELSERDIAMIYYDRGLSRIRWIAKQTNTAMEKQEAILSFDADMLPPKTGEAVPPKKKTHAPVWGLKRSWSPWKIRLPSKNRE